MLTRQLIFASLLSLLLLTGCQRDTPLAALEHAVQELQDNLEEKSINAVLEQLHPQFLAQEQYDSQWAKRTMALMFFRHKNVQVIALGTHSQIDPTYPDKGYTEANVTLLGAEGLLPDSARQYPVRMQWWLEQGEWRLARLDWDRD